MSDSVILWFRRDLRLDDNPALCAALRSGTRIVPVYIHAPEEEAPWTRGAASRWWLHHSLRSLERSLTRHGCRLWISRGDSLIELRRIAAATGARVVCWNRLYDPVIRARDTRIKQALRADGLRCESFNGALLFEPWEVTKRGGEPYRVFTAFWRNAIGHLDETRYQSCPDRLPSGCDPIDNLSVDALGLLPQVPWDQGLAATWTPGETAARERANTLLASRIQTYAETRDHPGIPGTSRLSPHLHFGEIGPRRLLALIRDQRDPIGEAAAPFVRQLVWREFAHHLLYHFPHTPEAPLNPRFADYPWRTDHATELLEAWQQGRTGMPLVDAGMRELWQTGWMHNRVRMVVASLLAKNLRLPWQEGARWFWDTLVDADLANNTLGWQWTAGCGADAAPYFRVLNPVRQGERFDPEGHYVRRWCPELARLPERYLHRPWAAPASILETAGIQLGQDYPLPIVDLITSRDEALAGWRRIQGSST